MNLARILVVDDEPAITELVSVNLRHSGYDVVTAEDAAEAQREVMHILPDLVLLDWMLPGQSGLQLAKQWRGETRTRNLPIIMLSARGDEADKIAGLDIGADDYLSKPFSTKELLARVRALLRRQAPDKSETPLESGGVLLNPLTHEVYYQDLPIKLGPTEFKLLKYLMSHARFVYSRRQLLDEVWGDHVFIEERTVDVQIKRLRDALETVKQGHRVETVRGAGYRWLDEDSGNTHNGA